MTISLDKRYLDVSTVDSSSSSSDRASIKYVITTDANEEEIAVRAYVKPLVPDLYDGLVFNSLSIERESEDVWGCTAEYVADTSQQAYTVLNVDDVRWSIRGSIGQTFRTKFSNALGGSGLVSEEVLSDRAIYKLAGTPIQNAIGRKYKANVGWEIEGREIAAGSVIVDVQTVKSPAQITAGYLVNAAGYAGLQSVNSADWRGFAAGTLRLINCSASERGSADPTTSPPDWDISFSMDFQPNQTGLVFAPGINPIDKKGQHMLDIETIPFTPEKMLNHQPRRVAVHSLFPEINYTTLLGI